MPKTLIFFSRADKSLISFRFSLLGNVKIWPSMTQPKLSGYPELSKNYPELSKNYPELSKNYPELSKAIRNYPKLSGAIQSLWIATENYPELSKT